MDVSTQTVVMTKKLPQKKKKKKKKKLFSSKLKTVNRTLPDSSLSARLCWKPSFSRSSVHAAMACEMPHSTCEHNFGECNEQASDLL